MQCHKVGLLQHLFHAQHAYSELAGMLRGDIGIKGDDLHFKPLCASSYFRADLAKANDAEYFIAYLDTQEAILFPFPSFETIIGGGNVTGQCHQHRHSVLRSPYDIARRGGDNHDALARCRLEIDVIHTHARAAYDPYVPWRRPALTS